MDPVNERRVFDLIVRTASRPKTAQYFLLSPKVSVPYSKSFQTDLEMKLFTIDECEVGDG